MNRFPQTGKRESRMKGKILMTFCVGLLLVSFVAAYGGPGLPREVLAEINLARTDPKGYAVFLREFRRQFQGKAYRQTGSPLLVTTTEGVRAVDEAVRFLARQKPLSPLAWSDGLAAAAAELVADEGESGETGHQGRKSGSPQKRIERHGKWQGEIGEGIGYGPDKARLMVMQLIIDDGVPDRGHRQSIFRSIYRTAGVACGPHPTYRNMCVVDYAVGFREGK
jgi:uncharacterized protein YkwD